MQHALLALDSVKVMPALLALDVVVVRACYEGIR